MAVEADLNEQRPFRFADPQPPNRPTSPEAAARVARDAVGLAPDAPVRDGGPAVVVNTWDRISVERWIFTAAHELGHLLLHPSEYRRDATDLPMQAEREADAFASEFLMPEAAFAAEWDETRGHRFLVRVLKVKRIFRVSYKTVLYRPVESGREPRGSGARSRTSTVATSARRFARSMSPRLSGRANSRGTGAVRGSPRVSPGTISSRTACHGLVRQALEEQHISLGRAAEILGLIREEMRQRAREWTG